jgi:hypothetical protein
LRLCYHRSASVTKIGEVSLWIKRMWKNATADIGSREHASRLIRLCMPFNAALRRKQSGAPSLCFRLEEVYGALTFYLAHEEEIDAYLRESNAQLEVQANARRARLRATKPELIKRLETARKEREALSR